MEVEMNFLVIGLGSMGKRRIRNLIALGYKDSIAGFEPRDDRRSEVERKYNIKTFDSLEKAMAEFVPDVFIVSTPPNMHMHYAYLAEKNNINCFIEASVVEAEKILELSKRIKDKKLIILIDNYLEKLTNQKELCKELDIFEGKLSEYISFIRR